MIESKIMKLPTDPEPLEISYFDTGSANTTLVCLHGIQGSKNTFERLLHSPLSQKIRIVVPDLPGFGGSEGPSDDSYDLDSQAGRLAQMFDELGLERIVIFGHSLGGMLGTLLLEALPDRVDALISSEGNLTLADCGESRRVAAMSFDEFESVRFPEIKLKGIAASAKAFYSTSKDVVIVSQGEHLLSILEKSQIPVLFIRGSKSHFATSPNGRNVRLLMLPEHTHFTLATSEEVLLAVSEFLDELEIAKIKQK